MKIVKIKTINLINKNTTDKPNVKRQNKYFVPSNIEWFNSFYFYNSNNIKYLPILDKISSKFIRVYFNMYDPIQEIRVGLRKLSKRKRWLSTRKVWINKIELKHTNDKVIINVQIYDRIYNIISKKLGIYFRNNFGFLDKKPEFTRTEAFYKLQDKRVKNLIRIKQSIKELSGYVSIIRNKFYKMGYFTPKIQNDPRFINVNMNKFKLLLSKIKEVKQLKNILNNSFSNERKFFPKEKIGIRSTKLLYYKNFIKNYTLKYKIKFIFKLQKIISKFYNKKVVFNIILLKNYYLNSNILTQILAHKSKNRDNKIYKTFKKTLVGISVPIFKKNTISRTEKEIFNQNVNVKYTIKEKRKINPTIIRYYKNNKNNLLNKLNNKTIIGVRLESAGRLTRRFTAQRAIKKIKYIGTLQTIDSSLKRLPTQMVRNNITSSLQYSKANSKNRIGSFGIKGWINSI